MKKIIIPGLSIMVLVALNACDTRTYDDISAKVDPAVKATYTKDIKPIMDANCVSCHSPSGQDDQPYLTNYTEVKAEVDAVIAAMKNTANPMPPNGLLPASTVNTISKWKTDGLLEK